MNSNWKIVIFGILSIIVILFLLIMASVLYNNKIRKNEEYSLRKGAKIGWTKKHVIEKSGKPEYVIKSSEELKDYSEGGGWKPVPQREVENEVLIYEQSFVRIYVYIGKDNKVDYIVSART